MAFKMRPKHHCLYHLSVDIKRTSLNPKVHQCVDEESWLGKVKAIACMTHGGCMPKRTMERYILGMADFMRFG